MIPEGRVGVQLGVTFFYIYMEYKERKSFEIFSKNEYPDKLNLVWKHLQVDGIKVCSNHDHRG